MEIKLHLQAVFQNDYVKVEIDSAHGLIYVEWLQHPDSQALREGFLKLADIVLASKSKYWLSDAKAIHYLEFADQNWLISEMAPVLKKSQLVKFARLTTQEGMLMMDVARLYEMVGKLTALGITTQLEMFTSKEAALEWLLS
ncbi:hypothetical protein OB13_03355 [Pontibacter sp. HJ8]